MDAATRDLVRRRAGDRCEYCLIRREHISSPLHVDHIVVKQHRLDDDPSNLALACDQCNRHKGPNLTGIDPESGRLVAFFHPRNDAWADHFALQGSAILGLTPAGRATIVVLAMNSIRQERRRAPLIASGLYP